MQWKRKKMQEIQEHIFNNYIEFEISQIECVLDFPHEKICETVDEMEKNGLVYWNDDSNKYVCVKNESFIDNISLRNFEDKVKEIKEISESMSTEIKISELKTGLFGGLKATEVEGRIEEIRNIFIDFSGHMVNVNKQFIGVYETFNALDKDYIQRMLINLANTKEANEKAVKSLQENKKIVDSQRKVINVLKKHKSELDELQHLKNIDQLYKDYYQFKEFLYEKIDTLYNFDIESSSHLNLLDEKIGKITNSQKELDKLVHLKDIDSIYDELNQQKLIQEKDINELNKNQFSLESHVKSLQSGIDTVKENQISYASNNNIVYSQFNRKIKILWGVLFINFIIILGLVILIVDGVF